MKNTTEAELKKAALDYIRACGPVSFSGTLHDCCRQVDGFKSGAWRDYDVVNAINNLIRDGSVELYEDGESYVVTSDQPKTQDETPAKPKVYAFELIDFGIDHAQYFPGCGVAFSRFDHVALGVGQNFAEAFNDCLEQIASDGFDVEDLAKRAAKENGFDADKPPTSPSVTEHITRELESEGKIHEDELEAALEESELHYYVAIRYCIEKSELLTVLDMLARFKKDGAQSIHFGALSDSHDDGTTFADLIELAKKQAQTLLKREAALTEAATLAVEKMKAAGIGFGETELRQALSI